MALPSPVAVVKLLITSSVLPSVCPIEAIFATICSTEEEDCATLVKGFENTGHKTSYFDVRFRVVDVVFLLTVITCVSLD